MHDSIRPIRLTVALGLKRGDDDDDDQRSMMTAPTGLGEQRCVFGEWHKICWLLESDALEEKETGALRHSTPLFIHSNVWSFNSCTHHTLALNNISTEKRKHKIGSSRSGMVE